MVTHLKLALSQSNHHMDRYSVKNTIFAEKTHAEKTHAFAAPKDATPQKFAEKTFACSHKTANFAKVSSLKSFPLYSNVSLLQSI